MGDKTISASEIGSYVYCSKAWWLRRKKGKVSTNVSEMESGTEAHVRDGIQVQLGSFLTSVAWVLVIIAIILLLRLYMGG